MSARVHVEDDWMYGDGIKVGMRDRSGAIYRWESVAMERVEEGVAYPDDAFLRLPDDVARALFNALASHYGAGTDLASLRKDYDAERKRVDTFIDHLTRVVRVPEDDPR